MEPLNWAQVAASGLPSYSSSTSSQVSDIRPTKFRRTNQASIEPGWAEVVIKSCKAKEPLSEPSQSQAACYTVAYEATAQNELPASQHPHTIRQTSPLLNLPRELWLMILEELHDLDGWTDSYDIYKAMLSMTCQRLREELYDGMDWCLPWRGRRCAFLTILGEKSNYWPRLTKEEKEKWGDQPHCPYCFYRGSRKENFYEELEQIY